MLVLPKPSTVETNPCPPPAVLRVLERPVLVDDAEETPVLLPYERTVEPDDSLIPSPCTGTESVIGDAV